MIRAQLTIVKKTHNALRKEALQNVLAYPVTLQLAIFVFHVTFFKLIYLATFESNLYFKSICALVLQDVHQTLYVRQSIIFENAFVIRALLVMALLALILYQVCHLDFIFLYSIFRSFSYINKSKTII